MSSFLANNECDEKVIIAFCVQINKRTGSLHLEERVLWFCLSKVKAYVMKQRWGSGVDTLKLGSTNSTKDFILKLFAGQKLSNYEIKIGNPALLRDIAKVSLF